MRRPLATVLATALLGSGIALTAAPAEAATGGALLYGVTSTNHLLSFRAQTPGTTASDVTITGLAPSETVLGLDIRPATGALVILGSTGRIYSLDPVTGAATATTGTVPTLSGLTFGLDVNPTVDRIRVVSDADQNLRLHPDTGVLVATDTALQYAAGDANVGANPDVNAVAYTNSVGGATSTTLFDLDTSLDILTTQVPPNNGTLNTVGALGVDATAVAGFDIDAATGTAYALLTVGGTAGLYTVNLTTGAVTLVGAAAVGLVDVTTATPRLRVLAATATEGGTATVTISRTGDLADAATVDYATSNGTATAGSDYTATTGTVSFAAGAATATFTVPTTADLVTEGGETVTVTLSNPTMGTVLSPATGTLSIVEPNKAYALTTDNKIATFALSTPGTFTSTVTVTGTTGGEDLVGIDVRPATGTLVGLGASGRVYAIDPATGAATATTGTPPALSGAAFGIDFNPTVDRIRVVSDTEQNLRLHPETGALAATDTNLQYAAGDANVGATPDIVGAGYTNNVAGATTTTLFDVDSTLNVLATQVPPNSGTLNTVGALGVDITAASDLDIVTSGPASAPVNTAFGAFTVGVTPSLYRVDTATGAASLVGAFATTTVEDLAITTAGRLVGPAVATDEAQPSVTVTVNRTLGTNGPLTVDYATGGGSATAGTDYTAASGTLSFADGETTKSFNVPLTQDTALEGPETFTVTYTGAAGGTAAPAATTVTIADDEAGTVYGLTTDNRIVTLDPVNPGAAPTVNVAVLGLGSGEDLLGIDVRPATGALYGLTGTGRILVIDPTTGGTQLAATSSTVPSGTAFGVDVNPVADRLRVVSNTGQSLRINMETGAATVDGTLAYATGDAGAGVTPAVGAAGYTNSTAGATATQLFDVDTARDALVLQNPPNSGTLTTVGALGLDVTSVAGLDVVSPGNSAFAVLASGSVAPSLYRVDLTTGAASSLGALSVTTLEDLAFPTTAVAKAGGYHALPPTRLLDTRTTPPALAGSADRIVTVAGQAGVPSTGVSAVVLNVTVTGSSNRGNVAVYPAGAKPATRTSNLNFGAGKTVAVQVQTGLGTAGAIGVSLSGGTAQVVIDVLGWYGDGTDTTGLAYQPLSPARLLDTRTTSTPLTAGSPQTHQVTGLAGVPAGAKAVAVNLTVTDVSTSLNVQLFPGGSTPATRTSSINAVRGQTVANAAVVTLGPDGSLGMSVSAGTVGVILDVVGYYGATGTSRFVPVTPARLVDTRTVGGPVSAGADRTVTVAGAGGVPTSAVAGVLSVTGTRTVARLNVQVYPTGMLPAMRTSTLNLVANADIANLAVTPLGTGGAASLRVSQFSTDLIVDVTGYFTQG